MGKRIRVCTVVGCERTAKGRNLCPRHNWRWQNHRSTDDRLRPTLEQQFWPNVLKSEGCWTWQGRQDGDGYGLVGTVRAHRFSYELAHGSPCPTGMQVDHICHNRACVNPGHLRVVTNKQNAENRGNLSTRNTSGVRGVSWNKRQNRWQAYVRHNGKLIHLGYFQHIGDAEHAAVKKRCELFTHNEVDRRR